MGFEKQTHARPTQICAGLVRPYMPDEVEKRAKKESSNNLVSVRVAPAPESCYKIVIKQYGKLQPHGNPCTYVPNSLPELNMCVLAIYVEK